MKRVSIEKWHPVSLNKLMNCHFGTRSKLKAVDRAMICCYCRDVSPAIMKRRIEVTICLRKGQRAPDPDNMLKSLLDSLVHAKVLRNDSYHWCESSVTLERRAYWWGTIIQVTDVPKKAKRRWKTNDIDKND